MTTPHALTSHALTPFRLAIKAAKILMRLRGGGLKTCHLPVMSLERVRYQALNSLLGPVPLRCAASQKGAHMKSVYSCGPHTAVAHRALHLSSQVVGGGHLDPHHPHSSYLGQGQGRIKSSLALVRLPPPPAHDMTYKTTCVNPPATFRSQSLVLVTG